MAKPAVLPLEEGDLSFGPCFGPKALDAASVRRFSVPASSYQVLRPLDSTGSSTVYLAEQRPQGSLVAVKRVCEQTSQQPFRTHVNEARVLARLEHPCLVRLLGLVVEAEGRLDLLLEFCPSGRLTTFVWRPNSGGQVVLLLRDLVLALAYLHEKRFAHLDVKPDNILVAAGRGKLCDLGTATRLGASGRLRGHVGTPGYRAPEVEEGVEFDAAAADLWSFGKVVEFSEPHTQGLLPRLGPLTSADPTWRPPLASCLRALEAALPEGGPRAAPAV